jgi:hypothetical protein
MTTFIEDLVPDELWALVEPLLPAPPRPPAGAAPSPTGRASPRSSTWPVPCTPWRLLPARELAPPTSTTPPCSRPSWTTCRRSGNRPRGGAPDPPKLYADKGVRQRGEPGLPAAAWDPAADRPTWGGVRDQAWAAPLAGRAVAVVAELLQAARGAVGPRCGAEVRVRAAGLALVCFNRL